MHWKYGLVYEGLPAKKGENQMIHWPIFSSMLKDKWDMETKVLVLPESITEKLTRLLVITDITGFVC